MSLIRNILQLTTIPKEIAAKKTINAMLKKLKLSTSNKLIPTNNFQKSYEPGKIAFKFDFSNTNQEFIQKIITHSDNIISKNYTIFNKQCNVLNDDNFIIVYTSIAVPPFKSFKIPHVHYNIDFFSPPFGKHFEWNSKLKSKNISIKNDNNADIKVPWEIGRLQELAYCALAYKYTGTDKHYENLIHEIGDFYRFNPVGYGPQWMSGMDASIRLINLLFIFDVLSTTKKIDDFVNKTELFELININAKFINKHSEWSDGMRGNHYLTNLTAMLIFLVHTKNEFRDKYLDGIVDKFIIELNHQFYDDGGNFESSTYYHALSAELVIWAYFYLGFVKDKIEPKKMIFIQEKAFKIYEFLKIFSKNDGTLFQTGDNDGGHILNFPHYGENQNKSYLIDLFEFVLNINDSNNYSKILPNHYNKFEYIPQDLTINSYGLVWQNDVYKLVLRNGKKGQNGKGGHDHSDQNSIMLAVNNTEFLVDPGTFSYTGFPELRDKFRSINYHNTLVIDNTEQYHFLKGDTNDLFWAFGKIETEIKRLEQNKFKAIAEYTKCKKLPNLLMNSDTISHNRTIELLDKTILISDNSDNNLGKKVNLHFAPKVNLMKIGDTLKAELNENSIIIKFPDDNFTIFEYEYSATYGIKEVAQKCVYISHNSEINWEIIIE